jgi:hypothetical protein
VLPERLPGSSLFLAPALRTPLGNQLVRKADFGGNSLEPLEQAPEDRLPLLEDQALALYEGEEHIPRTDPHLTPDFGWYDQAALWAYSDG